MRRSFWILLTMAALALVTVGIMSVAGADEALADGSYTLTVPGVGALTLDVAGSTVTVAADPTTGFDGLTATNNDGEFMLTSTTDSAFSIQVEADDGAFVSEFKIDLGPLTPDTSQLVKIGTYGSFKLIVAHDGSLSASELPGGFSAELTEEGLKLSAPDGSIIEIKADEGAIQATVSSPEADESSDETIAEEEQGTDEVSEDQADSEEVSSNDEDSDEVSDDQTDKSDQEASDSETDSAESSDESDGGK